MSKPTEPGYWWYRKHTLDKFEAVKAIRDGSGILWFCTYSGESGKVEETSADQWNGECR